MDRLAQINAALAQRYTLHRELARGGMARVYLATDERQHRSVALKVLHPELSTVVKTKRFLREIDLASRLAHPHIVPVYESGEAEGVLYYSMPFIEGEALRDRLDREKQLPVDDAVRIALEVADALAHAHSHGIVHRDIKPDNVLLQSGHAAVADFGLARAILEAGGERLTETGITLGTPAYISPEQASGERDLDGRSDIYSLGCVLFEMLAGMPPFVGASSQTVVTLHLFEPPPSLRGFRPTVPASIEAVIVRAMAKKPADRYLTAAKFSDALRSAFSGKSAQDSPATHANPRPLSDQRPNAGPQPPADDSALYVEDAADSFERLRAVLAPQYRIEREIGPGGVATVFLARDIRHGRNVALKVLRSRLASAIGAERFLGEIGVLARLQHPHVLPLIDSGEAAGSLYYVTPYVDGESLRQRLLRDRRLSVPEAVQIACEAAEALEYAHREKIIHRDIKPGNILLSEGHAVVSDFGIARAMATASTGKDALTDSGISPGTPAYMSPEQASGDRELDGRSDVYSLGCVLHEMLTGAPPFVRTTPPLVPAANLRDNSAPVLQTGADLPSAVYAVVMKSLAKDPDERYQTAAEFRDALNASMDAHLRAQTSVWKWAAAGAAVVAAAVIAGVRCSVGVTRKALPGYATVFSSCNRATVSAMR
ncbi:MAG: serine/threonine protein kinase [Anaerolineae bacterium]|nr:serine/threonine protein kinase [Gemmatimonadaceae bacterium]